MILCGIPGEHIPELSFLQWLRPDKVVHLILFGAMTFLLIRSFRVLSTDSFLFINAYRSAVLLSISYGVVVEILQSTVFIHRSADVRDAVANALGAMMGMWLYQRIIHTRETRKEK